MRSAPEASETRASIAGQRVLVGQCHNAGEKRSDRASSSVTSTPRILRWRSATQPRVNGPALRHDLIESRGLPPPTSAVCDTLPTTPSMIVAASEKSTRLIAWISRTPSPP